MADQPSTKGSYRTLTWAGEPFGMVDHALILNGTAWRTVCAQLWADGARNTPETWGHVEPDGSRPRCKRCMKKTEEKRTYTPEDS